MNQPIGSIGGAEGADSIAFAQKTSAKNLQALLALVRIEGQQKALGTVLNVAKAYSVYQDREATKKTTEKSSSTTTQMTKTQIKYMRELLNLLSKYLADDPAAAAQIAKWKGELSKIQNDYPNLTPSDVKNLKDMFEGANSLASSKLLPKHPNEYQKFLKTEIDMFKQLRAEDSAAAKQLEKTYEIHLKAFEQLYNVFKDLETIRNALKKMEDGSSFTEASLIQLLSAVDRLSGSIKGLPAKYKTLVTVLFENMKGISSSVGLLKNVHLSGFLADLRIYIWTQEFLKKHPEATKAELIQYLKGQIGSWEKSAGSNIFTNAMLGEMKADLKSFPQSHDFPGFSRFTDKNFIGYMIDNMKFRKETVSQALYDAGHISSQLDKLLKKEKATLLAEQNELTQLKALDKNFGKAEANLKAKDWSTQSLPNQFAHDILDHFMPEQEKFLRILAESLQIANFGAGMFNEILSGISDFSDANANYNLNQWLTNHDKNGIYNESPTKVKGQITKEKNQATTDKGEAQAKEAYVQKQLAEIKAKLAQLKKEYDSGKISKSNYDKLSGKYKKMQTQLTTLSTNLKQAITYLSNLITFLGKLKVHSVSGKSNESTISGPKNWGSTLSADQGNVINGYSGTPPPAIGTGGLLHISGMVNGDQSMWGTQSQQDQMNLQMTMTVIQQEWSIVSTAEQLLNQMYLGVARGINPR